MKIEQLSLFDMSKKKVINEINMAMKCRKQILKELNEYKLFI